MRFIERKQKMEYLLELVEKGRCFSCKEISRKFNCSTRTVKRLLADLREDGHEIRYCKIRRMFFKTN